MIIDDVQTALLDPVAQRDYAAHPHSLLFRSRDLISDPLAGDFPFELGEGQEHVKGQPSHARRGVERLGHRYEGDIVPVERLDQLGEVGERPGQPIDLIDDDTSIRLASTSASSFCSAGRSIEPPEKPPSS